MLLLLRFWREGAIVLLVLTLMAACHARDTALTAAGIARERYRVADSTLAVTRPQLARVDTLLVHNTVKVRVAVERVVTLTDTVLHHLTDTVLVKTFVTRADSAAQACLELSNDCQAFRVSATTTIRALEAKLAAAPMVHPASTRGATVLRMTISGALGLGAGWMLRGR